MEGWNDKRAKENPYKVPDGYFDQLYDQIVDQKTEKSKIATWWPGRKWAIGLATVMLASGIYGVLKYTSQQEKECVSLACIDDQTLINAAAQIESTTLMEYIRADADTSTHLSVNLEEVDDSALLEEL